MFSLGWWLGSPARAGMALCRPRSGSSRPRLPRPRGDGPARFTSTGSICTAPPPARGWPWRRVYSGDCRGSPARAGMAPCISPKCRHGTRLPRPRGDGTIATVRRWRACGHPRAGMPGAVRVNATEHAAPSLAPLQGHRSRGGDKRDTTSEGAARPTHWRPENAQGEFSAATAGRLHRALMETPTSSGSLIRDGGASGV